MRGDLPSDLSLAVCVVLLRKMAHVCHIAKVDGVPLRDASDFHRWLLLCAELAAQSTSLEDLYSLLDISDTLTQGEVQ